MKKKLLAALLSAALICAALPGCGGGSAAPNGGAENAESAAEERASDAAAPGGSSRENNELFVGIAQDLDESLDPHKSEAAGTREVLFNVFEGLVKPTPEGDLAPALAESWTISDDHLTYTFTLRPDALFHNGAAVTAEDVRYSLLRRVEGGADAEIISVPAFSAIDTIEIPDGNTLVLTLTEPSVEFLSYLTSAVIPQDYDGQDTAPVGTGPFRFVSRTAQDSLVLERFDGYWGEKAKLDRVTYRIIENADSILMSLQSGAVDLFAHLTTTQVRQLGDEFQIAEGTMNLVQALYLNNAVAPFDDTRVRQALCCAVDRQAVLDLAFDGYGALIGSSMYPAFGKYFLEDLTDFYPHDIERAKELLAQAGYPDGFSMTITVPSNYQPHIDTAQVIAQQLREVGIDAELRLVEWGAWLSDVYSGRNFESTVIGVDASNMTARALLERFVSTAGNNFMNYSSAEYDRLFAAAQECYDDAEQTALYQEMERNLTENAANVYIQDMADLVALRQGLTGLRFYPIYVLDLSGLGWEA